MATYRDEVAEIEAQLVTDDAETASAETSRIAAYTSMPEAGGGSLRSITAQKYGTAYQPGQAGPIPLLRGEPFGLELDITAPLRDTEQYDTMVAHCFPDAERAPAFHDRGGLSETAAAFLDDLPDTLLGRYHRRYHRPDGTALRLSYSEKRSYITVSPPISSPQEGIDAAYTVAAWLDTSLSTEQ